MFHNDQKRNNLASALVLATGVLAGAALAYFVKENRFMNPQKVLVNIQHSASPHEELTGGWINHNVLDNAEDDHPFIYQGGITRRENHEDVHYVFLADAYSGELLDFSKTNK